MARSTGWQRRGRRGQRGKLGSRACTHSRGTKGEKADSANAHAVGKPDYGAPISPGRSRESVLQDPRRGGAARALAATAPVLGEDGAGRALDAHFGRPPPVQLRRPGRAEGHQTADRRRHLGPEDSQECSRSAGAASAGGASTLGAGAGGDRRCRSGVPGGRGLRGGERPGVDLRSGGLRARGRGLSTAGGRSRSEAQLPGGRLDRAPDPARTVRPEGCNASRNASRSGARRAERDGPRNPSPSSSAKQRLGGGGTPCGSSRSSIRRVGVGRRPRP